MTKYFVISDIHSHYNAMIKALKSAGFSETNADHKLIILGDLFDRGPDAHAVLMYVRKLVKAGKAHVILGNHDDFLIAFLEGDDTKTEFNIGYNGFGVTLESLSGKSLDAASFETMRQCIKQRYPDLHAWLKGLPLTCEIADYVFVHGGIDGSNPDWKTTTKRQDFLWNHQHLLPPLPNKIIVVGHTRIPTVRAQTLDYKTLYKQNPEQFDILYGNGFIMIDRFVEVSNALNVLVLALEGDMVCA